MSERRAPVLRVSQRERLLGHGNRLLNVLFAMSRAEKCGFKLGRRQIDTIVQHRLEETPESFGVRFGSGRPIRDRAAGKEPGKHRTHTVVADGKPRLFRGGCNPRDQFVGFPESVPA